MVQPEKQLDEAELLVPEEAAVVVEAGVVSPVTDTVRPREDEIPEEMERPSKRVRIEEAVKAEEVKQEPKEEEVQQQIITPRLEEIKAEEKVNVEPKKEEDEVEEQEPPEYSFEPEVLDLSTSDMYLDTVSSSCADCCAYTNMFYLDKSIGARFRF